MAPRPLDHATDPTVAGDREPLLERRPDADHTRHDRTCGGRRPRDEYEHDGRTPRWTPRTSAEFRRRCIAPVADPVDRAPPTPREHGLDDDETGGGGRTRARGRRNRTARCARRRAVTAGAI